MKIREPYLCTVAAVLFVAWCLTPQPYAVAVWAMGYVLTLYHNAATQSKEHGYGGGGFVLAVAAFVWPVTWLFVAYYNVRFALNSR